MIALAKEVVNWQRLQNGLQSAVIVLIFSEFHMNRRFCALFLAGDGKKAILHRQQRKNKAGLPARVTFKMQ